MTDQSASSTYFNCGDLRQPADIYQLKYSNRNTEKKV